MIKFVDAIVDRNFKKVAYFLGQGADPNSVIDASGLSGMHFACQSSVSIFKCLLDHGGSIFNVNVTSCPLIETNI